MNEGVVAFHLQTNFSQKNIISVICIYRKLILL